MPGGDHEIMTPMSSESALMQAHIHALRQVSDGISRVEGRLDAQGTKIDTLTEKVIGLEKSGYDVRLAAIKADLDKMQAQVDVLKSQRDQALGAMSLTGWLSKYAPWLLAGIAAFAAGAGLKLK